MDLDVPVAQRKGARQKRLPLRFREDDVLPEPCTPLAAVEHEPVADEPRAEVSGQYLLAIASPAINVTTASLVTTLTTASPVTTLLLQGATTVLQCRSRTLIAVIPMYAS